jgi:predicted RNA binding protein YcfA (HicA-like mRNA interferase family)
VSYWPSYKAKKLFRVLQRIGWEIKEVKGSSHIQIVHPEHGEATWAFHDSDEIGPKMMGRICKQYHVTREDL